MTKRLGGRGLRVLILSSALALSVGIYANAEFGAALTRQAKAEAASVRLADDQARLAAAILTVRGELLADAAGTPDGAACSGRASEARNAERRAIEHAIGAPLTSANAFGYCMRGYYGVETRCITWLFDEERASLERFAAAHEACSAR